ncbi:MAG TPA: transposase [Nitrosomonas sp.]|nr:transposase [Nitrosomonas sp.]
MRQGRKSSSNRFNGYEASIAVEEGSKIIADIDVLPANAHDNPDAPQLVEGAEKNLYAKVDTILGDGAYGTTEARLDAIEHGYNIIATVGRAPCTRRFTKENFTIDLENNRATCPNHETTDAWRPTKTETRRGTIFQDKTFQLSDKQCCDCPLRSKCIQGKTKFTTILVHQEEVLLQQARRTQKTDEFRQAYRKRVVDEHRLARLVHLGIRKARYFGSKKYCTSLRWLQLW